MVPRAIAPVLAFSAMLALACSDQPSKSQCEKLLNHYLELEIVEAKPAGKLKKAQRKQLEAQKKSLKAYLHKRFINVCTDQLSQDFVSCALKTRDKRALTNCGQ